MVCYNNLKHKTKRTFLFVTDKNTRQCNMSVADLDTDM